MAKKRRYNGPNDDDVTEIASLGDQQWIKDHIEYHPIHGTLRWKRYVFLTNGWFPRGDHCDYAAPGAGRRTERRVRINDTRFHAEHIAWFLHTGNWPAHGIIFKDRSRFGKCDLKRSNLVRRPSPTYKSKRWFRISDEMLERIAAELISGDVYDQIVAMLDTEEQEV